MPTPLTDHPDYVWYMLRSGTHAHAVATKAMKQVPISRDEADDSCLLTHAKKAQDPQGLVKVFYRVYPSIHALQGSKDLLVRVPVGEDGQHAAPKGGTLLTREEHRHIMLGINEERTQPLFVPDRTITHTPRWIDRIRF